MQGVCGLQDEAFAGAEQQEAHDLLAGLLLWLHKNLASRVRLIYCLNQIFLFLYKRGTGQGHVCV